MTSSKEIVRHRQAMVKILADNSGQPVERVEKDTDRDHWMSAAEAVAYGLADGVLSPSRLPAGLSNPSQGQP